MSTSSADHRVPWDMMKAETMRAILKDLGLKPPKSKREDMIECLQQMERDGCMFSDR